MKFYRWNKHYLGWGITAFVVIALSIVLVMMLSNLESIGTGIGNFIGAVSPIIYGFIIAYLLAPVVKAFETKVFRKAFTKYDTTVRPKVKVKKITSDDDVLHEEIELKPYVTNKVRRGISVAVTFVIIFGILIGMIAALIPQLTSTLKMLVANIPSYIDNISIWVTNIFQEYPDMGAQINDMIDVGLSNLQNYLSSDIIPRMGDYLGFLTNSVMTVIGIVMNIFFGIVVAVYCLYSKELFSAQLKKTLYSLVSVNRSNKILVNIRKIHKSFGNFITGTLIDSFVVGCITFIVSTIAGVPFSVLVSVIMGLTNIIPYFGPFIGLVPSLILIFMENPVMCIVFTVIVLIIQNLNGNIISPKILGGSTGLTSFWVIFAILVGQGIFGFWGLIIGIPLFAVIFSTVKAFITDRLENKGLPSGSYAYTDIATFREEDMTPVSLSETLAAEQAEKARKDAAEREIKKAASRERREKIAAKVKSFGDKKGGSAKKDSGPDKKK